MTETHDDVWESYHCAFNALVTGMGGLRERLHEAMTWLRKAPKLPAIKDEHDAQVFGPLPKLLERGEQLDTMADKEMSDFAWDIYRVYDDVTKAGENEAERLNSEDLVDLPTYRYAAGGR